MIILSPSNVTLGTVELTHVDSVLLSRTADRLVIEHTDQGSHVGFVDVPERRSTFTIRRRVQDDEAAPAKPGDSVALAFNTAESAAAGRARRISASVVVTSVINDLAARRSVIQTITAIAFSTDGIADPVTESLVSP
ncbi:MAG: hypothetical protein ACKVZJ_14810 [Phycisphaerales bacterium]